MTEQHQTILDAFLTATWNPTINLLPGSHGGMRQISHEELFARGCALAHKFRSFGLNIGDRVMTILPTNLPFLISTFGAWCAGAAIVPIAPPPPANILSYYQKKLVSMIQTAEPKVIIVSESTLDIVKSLTELTKDIVILPENETLFDFTGEPLPPYIPHREDAALVQFTSGSTSYPKGAVIKHKHLVMNVRGIGQVVVGGNPSDEIVASWLPVHHDMGFIGGLCFPFYHGCDLHLIPTETFIRNPAIWLKTISAARATLSPAPTFAYDLLGSRISTPRLEGIDLSSWRYAWVGAEPIFPKTLETFTERFKHYGMKENTLKPCYGLAEATLAVTLTPLAEAYKIIWIDQKHFRETGFAKPSQQGVSGSSAIACCGIPVTGTEIKITNNEDETLSDYRRGRVLVRGLSVMEGYLGNISSPVNEGGWLDTGDLGFKIGEEIYITGRAKDLIIRGGVNIHPHEIEKIADAVEGVRMGTATAFSYIRHDIGREEIVLVVETRQKKAEIREEIREEISRKVARDASVQLDRIELVPPGTVPKTTSGKIQRNLCRENFISSKFD